MSGQRIAEYLAQVKTMRPEFPEWRLGQTYFNVLAQVRPDLAERVRSTAVDPFNFDFRIADFLVFISDNWDGTTS